MIVALILLALTIATVLFHFLSPWWWTPIASNWGAIDDTMNVMFAITGLACVAIMLFMAYCVFRFHHSEGRRAVFEPQGNTLELALTTLTSIGTVAMLAPGLIVWREFITVPPDASEVEVVGQQWQWSYRFPGKDNKLGLSDTRFVSADNPLGVDIHDPNGRDDVLVIADDLHLPLGKNIKVVLRSLDVLHDFYVPEFRAKMDLVPGMVTYFWLRPTRSGEFDILCAELCGVGHPQMRGKVIVEPETNFRDWLSSQKTFAQMREMERAESRRAPAGGPSNAGLAE
jgi:cytochrome c oxidase subunit 2